MSDFAVIGHRVPRADGPAKVTGQALYTGDIPLQRLLIGKILHSPLPHARILSIDTTRAERLPGVSAVMTGRDTKGVRYSQLAFRDKYMDRLALEIDKVRFIGDPIAAVAAVDEDTAEAAVRLIEVEYEKLPAVFTVEEAAAEGAPLIHEERPGNITREIRFNFGEVDQAFADSYYVREDSFVTQAQAHAPLETHGCTASYDSTGKLTVWTGIQGPTQCQFDLAKTLGIPRANVRVILPYVGGSFGAKDVMSSMDFCASLLSMQTGRPVRILNSREAEFHYSTRRHPLSVWMRTGVARDGEILARDVRVVLDGGAYNSCGPATVLTCGIFINLPYRYKTFRYYGVRYYTNNPVGGALRGHGSPQMHLASDVQLDRIAEALGMDPIDIRLRNALRAGETTLNGFKIASSGFKECLETVRDASGWREKRGKLPPNRGIGVGCGGFPSGTGFRQRPQIPTYSAAVVRLNDDATVTLLCGASDIGQGVDNVLMQITAEELGINMEEIRLVRADTDLTPTDLGSGSSRDTVYAGNAVKMAAADLRQQLLAHAADKLEASIEDLESRLGKVYVKGSPDKAIDFKDLAFSAKLTEKGKPFVGQGQYDPPDKINYAAYTFGAQIAEVEVDPDTGQVHLTRMTSAHDCGRAINPMAVEGQLEGSVHLAVGWTFTEDLRVEDGRELNASYLGYKIPTAVDTPPVTVYHIESNDPEGPYGAKEAGEGIVSPTAPAIANAVYNATGMWVDSLPLAPEKVVDALGKRSARVNS